MTKEKTARELSLYIHIPFCKQKCAYCDFLSFDHCGNRLQKEYVDALIKEISVYQSVSADYIVKTIFIGGGTPSYIDSEWIVNILDTVRNVFCVDEDAEITIEGNPDSLTRQHLADYKKAGINRISIGLQSANAKSLQCLQRVHNYDQFVAAFQNARQEGFANINVDIMSALPGETMEDYIRTLAKVVEMNPEHISAYSLIVEENTPLSENQELLNLLPSEELDRQMYSRTKTLLKNSGYQRYEISNYSKPGMECRHNIVYWTGEEYLGVGLGASSYLKVYLSDMECKEVRFHGVEQMEEYIGRFSKCDGMMEDDYTNLYHEMEEDSMYEMEDLFNMGMYEEDAFSPAEQHLREYRKLEDNPMLEFIRDYYKDLYFLKRKDRMEEMMFLGLRMMQGVSFDDFKERFGVSMQAIYGDVLERNIQRGLLFQENGRIFLSEKGIDVSNIVMADFML